MPDEKSLLSQLIEVPEEDAAAARERALLSQFEPVRTFGGYAKEAPKASLKGFVSELGGSTLKGFSAFQTAIERNNLEEGRALVKAQTERMKNPAAPMAKRTIPSPTTCSRLMRPSFFSSG